MTEGIFASTAPQYAALGLRVFPTGGPDGKKPLIKNWPRVGTGAAIELASKFPDSNIGLLDGGKNGITRVDIDDPDLIDGALERFGETPLKIATPSGGLHLVYRANGERRLLGFEGKKIDLLGVGGFGVAPPSVNPLKGVYSFAEGSLEDFAHLPTIPPEALPLTAFNDNIVEPASARTTAVKRPEVMRDGDGRNAALFNMARELARTSPTCDEHLISVFAANAEFAEPLPEQEVQQVAASAWGYQAQGMNWGGEAGRYVAIPEVDFDALIDAPDALLLWLYIRREHYGIRARFRLVIKDMATRFRWGSDKFRAARDVLIARGMIARTHQGGKSPGDAAEYAFSKGPKTGSNTNYTAPPPLLPLSREQKTAKNNGRSNLEGRPRALSRAPGASNEHLGSEE